jgi:hypothetical protein
VRPAPWFGEHDHLDGYTGRTLSGWGMLGGMLAAAAGIVSWSVSPDSDAGVALVLVGAPVAGVCAVLCARAHRRFVASWGEQTKASEARQRRKQMEGEAGQPAVARIAGATTVGELGTHLVIDIDVQVTRDGREPYSAVIRRACFDPLEAGDLRPGRELAVRVDPEDPAVVLLPGRMRYDG